MRDGVAAARALVSSLLLACVNLGCISGEARPPSAARAYERPKAHLGTWVWQKQTVLDAERRSALLAFAEARGISELFVAIADDFEAGPGFEAFAELVRGAQRQHLDVLWVAGDPSWARTDKHARALDVVAWAVRINRALRARSLPAVRGLQYDVEPYLLPEWSSGRVEEQYAALLDELRTATREAGLDLLLAVPFWLGERSARGTSLGIVAARASDELVVMAYRSNASAVADKATPLLRLPEARPRSILVAVETSCREPAQTTLCGVSSAELDATLAQVGARLGGEQAFGGLAVHDYPGWLAITKH
jgi:hypothetical protein